MFSLEVKFLVGRKVLGVGKNTSNLIIDFSVKSFIKSVKGMGVVKIGLTFWGLFFLCKVKKLQCLVQKKHLEKTFMET